jgi:hypothetical protein
MKIYKSEYYLSKVISEHYIFKNYANIINQENFIKPEIAQCIYLENGCCISIVKTIWLRFIQRSWKKVYKIRKEILNKRISLQSVLFREKNGRWPDSCSYLPGIKGLLHYLDD